MKEPKKDIDILAIQNLGVPFKISIKNKINNIATADKIILSTEKKLKKHKNKKNTNDNTIETIV
jgi:hypothetical protein